MSNLKRKFNIALAASGNNLTKQAKVWGVTETALRYVVEGKRKSARLTEYVENYIKSVSIDETFE